MNRVWLFPVLWLCGVGLGWVLCAQFNSPAPGPEPEETGHPYARTLELVSEHSPELKEVVNMIGLSVHHLEECERFLHSGAVSAKSIDRQRVWRDELDAHVSHALKQWDLSEIKKNADHVQLALEFCCRQPVFNCEVTFSALYEKEIRAAAGTEDK